MRLSLSLSLFGSCFALVGAILARIEVAVAWLFKMVAEPLDQMSFAGFAFDAGTGFAGPSIEPSLYHANRHEAGVSRRSAARNT